MGRFLLVVAINLLVFLASTSNAMTKRIFIIQYSHPGYEWPTKIEREIKRRLSMMKTALEYETVYFNSLTSDEILGKLDRFKPDIVLMTGDTVCETMMKPVMNRKIPVFFTAVNRRKESLSWLKDEWRSLQAGVIEDYNIVGAIRVLRSIKPIGKLAIIGGDFFEAHNMTSRIKEEVALSSPEIDVKVFHERYAERWYELLPQLSKDYDAIWLLLPFFVVNRSDEKPVDWTRIGRFVSENVYVPTIGIGRVSGAVPRLFAYTVKPEELGRQVAIQIYRFINGVPLKDIDVEYFHFHQLTVNREEVKRLKLYLPDSLIGYSKFVN